MNSKDGAWNVSDQRPFVLRRRCRFTFGKKLKLKNFVKAFSHDDDDDDDDDVDDADDLEVICNNTNFELNF